MAKYRVVVVSGTDKIPVSGSPIFEEAGKARAWATTFMNENADFFAHGNRSAVVESLPDQVSA